ncbi:MAG: RNA methyltransferase [Prevotellaceae bacterium]|jgi:tRNA G18 (ribose-2'-O)-methylase SpoU|nr:RNA methyltransferase [Prevotellaceae bacterium]
MSRKLANSELNRLKIDEYKTVKKRPIVLVLDNIRSLHNIGAAFRTGDAFRIEKIYLCGICGTPPNAEIHKSALGAEDSVEWEYYKDATDAIQKLKRKGYTIIGIEQVENSIALNEFAIAKEKRHALVFGNEVKGISQPIIDMCDCCIEIPQEGTKHSLNVSVSIGVVLWDFYCKMR